MTTPPTIPVTVPGSPEIVACTDECTHPPGETAGHPFPGRPGYITGLDGHAVAGSEWKVGYRICERCQMAGR